MLHIRTAAYANCLDCGQTVQILSDRIPALHAHTGLYSCRRKKPAPVAVVPNAMGMWYQV